MLVQFRIPVCVVVGAMVLAMATGADAVSPLDSGGSAPPTATMVSPTANVVIAPGGTVNFQGSGTDSDGSISAYRWTFDGVTADSTAQNPGNVTFASAGAYHIYLLATDDKGVMNFASRWVFVL
jgi:PKD repeat protein